MPQCRDFEKRAKVGRMGKIYDALEKSDQHVAKKIPLTQPLKIGNVNGEEKVVNLTNAHRYTAENRIDPNLITYHASQSVEAEIFKVLRTNLLFPLEGKPPKTLLVTSAVPGEGKSFVCANLAISIAQGVEEYVMLVDGDIRKPSIHTLFGLGQVKGLSEYLSSQKELSQILYKSTIPKLTILPGGMPPMNPSELLTSKKMKTLLLEVTKRYDNRYVIIDSPPPSMAPETVAMSKFVDAVLFVVRAGKTQRKAVEEAIEQIGKDKVIGIVLNCSNETQKKYHEYGAAYYLKK